MAAEKTMDENINQIGKTIKVNLFSIAFSRLGIIVLLLAIQASYLIALFVFFGRHLAVAFGGTTLFALIMAIYHINTDENASVKITWIVLTMIAPVFAVPLYFFIKSDIGFGAVFKRQREIEKQLKVYTGAMGCPLDAIEKEKPELYNIVKYASEHGGFSLFENTDISYFPTGEDKFEQMLTELEGAKKFIFFEYFILADGHMWNEILKILVKKASEGVEVRVMYDGTCAFSTLPYSYPKKLRALGIDCKMYAPILPFVSTHYNNRDHRKILVIDGHTAFTGGINIADEYINKIEKHGHWKDTAIMLKGDAVKSFTIMFLTMWNMTGIYREDDYQKYIEASACAPQNAKGWVMPYGDNPLDQERVGEMVYLDIINQAKDYVYIMSPYLVLDGEMETALCFAAKKGIDIKIMLPHVPDKKMVYAVAKRHSKTLIKAGVEIYEYTPGFVHAKSFVSDKEKAVVGTINLDYRSLYHHFECAAYIYNAPVIEDIEKDFLDTLTKCQRVTLESLKKDGIFIRLTGVLLKLFAPLI